MNLGIKGKRALVTGASRGIGESIAEWLAKEGVQVAVVARTQSQIYELVERMGGKTKGHLGIALDLMPAGSATTLTNKMKAAGFWPLDIVVQNVGGTMDITNPLCSLKDWQKVWRFNFEIAIEINLKVIPSMRQKKWGRLIHIGSTSSVENNGPVTYCTAKAGLAAYSHSLGRVLAPEGIVVTCIFPGAILTKGGYWEQAMVDRPDHVKKYLADRCPLHKFGEPDDIGPIVAFLCSDLADFFQGSVIPVDGGQIRGFLS